MTEGKKENSYQRLLKKTRAKAVITSGAEPLSEEEADVMAVVINTSLEAPPIIWELDEEVVFSSLDLNVSQEEAERLIRRLLVDDKGYDSEVVDEYIKFKRGADNAKA